jgi:hypothetical protein
MFSVENLRGIRGLAHVLLPDPKKRTDGDFFRGLRAQYHRYRSSVSVLVTWKILLYFKFVRVGYRLLAVPAICLTNSD